MCYRLSGLDTLVSNEWIELFKKGTSTTKDASEQDLKDLKELLFSTIEKTAEDIEAGIFKEFTEYPTSTGFVLRSVNDAFEFNNFHEGIHLGYICLLYTSPSPRDQRGSRMPSSA